MVEYLVSAFYLRRDLASLFAQALSWTLAIWPCKTPPRLSVLRRHFRDFCISVCRNDTQKSPFPTDKRAGGIGRRVFLRKVGLRAIKCIVMVGRRRVGTFISASGALG